eukprot:augustus_masked-scaffold_8-processed-gene-3.1-mRNA-1 protein AED:1.00 eAED:1.00 QI:0/0/0/0/1/1/3/0/500
MPVMQPRADPVEFLELMDGPNGVKVKGILDSGAAKTIGNVRYHKRFCSMLHPVHSNLSFQLENYEPIPIALIGDVEIRVKVDDDEPVYLGRVRIFMVDDESSFSELYIGKETLFDVGALPEQSLRKMPSWQRNLLAPYSMARRDNHLKDIKFNLKHMDISKFCDVDSDLIQSILKGNIYFLNKRKEKLALNTSDINFIAKEIDLTSSGDTVPMDEAASILQLPSDAPVQLGSPYSGMMGEDVPSITYFGGDGPNLEAKEEQEQMKSYLEKHLKESEVITEAERTGKVSRLTPVPCHLVHNAPPGIFVKPRPIGQKEEIWLKNRIDELIEAKILKRVSDPVYSVPIHIVPKKSDDSAKQFRLVVDMRRIDDFTIRTSLNLPFLEQQLQRTSRARYFACLDVMSGFDYLPIEEESKKFFNMATPWGASYEFQGTVQGWKNSPLYFQNRVFREVLEPLGYMEPDRLSCGMIQWVDDVLLYAKNLSDLNKMLAEVLSSFEKRAD